MGGLPLYVWMLRPVHSKIILRSNFQPHDFLIFKELQVGEAKQKRRFSVADKEFLKGGGKIHEILRKSLKKHPYFHLTKIAENIL